MVPFLPAASLRHQLSLHPGRPGLGDRPPAARRLRQRAPDAPDRNSAGPGGSAQRPARPAPLRILSLPPAGRVGRVRVVTGESRLATASCVGSLVGHGPEKRSGVARCDRPAGRRRAGFGSPIYDAVKWQAARGPGGSRRTGVCATRRALVGRCRSLPPRLTGPMLIRRRSAAGTRGLQGQGLWPHSAGWPGSSQAPDQSPSVMEEHTAGLADRDCQERVKSGCLPPDRRTRGRRGRIHVDQYLRFVVAGDAPSPGPERNRPEVRWAAG